MSVMACSIGGVASSLVRLMALISFCFGFYAAWFWLMTVPKMSFE